MKIVLLAFGNKLSGVMEVPEGTDRRFKLAMTQPISVAKFDSGKGIEMNRPIETIVEFEWTGGTFSEKGHNYDGAREYQMISIDKR